MAQKNEVMVMKEEIVNVENPSEFEIIVGQGNFSVYTVDDLYRTIYASVPNVKFAIAINEAKPQLVRVNGNDEELKKLASKACLDIGGGHVFVIYMKGAYPLHVLNAVKHHPCVANVYVATSNPLQILVRETELGRAVVGVVDGKKVTSVETEEEKRERRELVKKFGYSVE
jgi:hypothetical protein